MDSKKPDLLARGLSILAILVSAGSIWSSYRVGVAARIESSRPRLTVEVEIARSGQLPNGPGQLNLLVSVMNGGVSPARAVRVQAKPVFTNAPQYAIEHFTKSLECANLGFDSKRTLYPGKGTSDILSLDLPDIEPMMNPALSFKSGNVKFINGQAGIFIVGCVTYGMDGDDQIFMEQIFQHVDARCGIEKRSCSLPLNAKSELPIQITMDEWQ